MPPHHMYGDSEAQVGGLEGRTGQLSDPVSLLSPTLTPGIQKPGAPGDLFVG